MVKKQEHEASIGVYPNWHSQLGSTLYEVLSALVIFGAVGVSLLIGMQVSANSVTISQEHVTFESLAKRHLEEVKGLPYVQAPTSYTDKIHVNPDLTDQGYSVTADAEALLNPSYDNNIQRITIKVTYSGDVFILEGFKVNR